MEVFELTPIEEIELAREVIEFLLKKAQHGALVRPRVLKIALISIEGKGDYLDKDHLNMAIREWPSC